jgi:type VI secretion system VasD/TssJ family lipoprotein
MTASQHINALPGEPGLPVQVRVYQLKSADGLDNRSFEEVWTQAAKLFGEALLEAREYTVYPREQRQWTAALLPEARTLAFVALFREPHGSDWFVTYDVESSNEQAPCVGEVQFSVWLDGMRLRAGAGPGEATHINQEHGE